MNKFFILFIVVFLAGLLIGYFSFQQTLKNYNNGPIVPKSKTDTGEVMLANLTEVLNTKIISESFFNEALSYGEGKKQFLPETLQLFKNIEIYNKLISSGGKVREDGLFFDANTSIKYLLHFMDKDALKDAGAISDLMASYENLLFLKNPSNYPQFVGHRKENAQILEWKNTGKIPKSVSPDDVYLNFLFSDISREALLSKKNDFSSKNDVKDILSIQGFILGFGFDIFNKDINTLMAKPDIKDYLINNRIDFFYIDKSFLTGKNLCGNILNPDIKNLCEMHVTNNYKNAKYSQIMKEFFIHKLLYR